MEKTPAGPRMWGSARRFEPGTVTHTALVGLTAAIEWRESVGGYDATHAAAMELAGHLRERLVEVPKAVVSDVDAPSPFVAFELTGMPAPVVVRKLEDQGIVARSLPGTDLTRIAVGCWNDRSDIDRLVTALSAL
jgi:L-cysteine/cystine lyase